MELYTIPISDPAQTGKFILFRPLAGLAFVGNRAMANLAGQLAREEQSPGPAAGPALAFLEQIGFLEPDPPEPAALETDFKSLVLLLTNSCQLRCTYCYAAAGERPHEELSEEHGRAAIDYLFAQAEARGQPEVTVSFHGGGEPTYVWRLLLSLTAYARSKTPKAVISLTTNGIWSEQQREWILANVDRIGISMDGAPFTQDAQRPLSSGQPSSPVLMRNLAELDRRGVQYGVRMTATAPWERLPEDVAFICEQTNAQAIQVEPAFNTSRGKHLNEPDMDWRGFAEAFVQGYDVAQAHNRRLHYSGARAGTVATTFCTAPFDALVVGPGGRITACYEITNERHPLAGISNYGSVAGERVQVDQDARAGLHGLFAERRAGCRDCFCYWSCAGDCYVQGFTAGPDGHRTRAGRCELNRAISEQMLLRMIAAGEGYWSARRDPALMGSEMLDPLDEELHG